MIEIDRTTQITVSALDPAVFLGSCSAGPAAESTLRVMILGDDMQASVQEITFQVEFIGQVDGGFVAHVPALPSASTQGGTLDEAFRAVRENLEGILESNSEGLIVPHERREYLAGPQDQVNVVAIRRDAAA